MYRSDQKGAAVWDRKQAHCFKCSKIKAKSIFAAILLTRAEVNDRPLSKVTCRVRGDQLILNEMILIPVNDHFIASLEDDKAEIIFLDPDRQVVHVKIFI